MSKEKNSIHEMDLNIIVEYFSNFERQGPGSPEMTIKALSFIDNLNADSHIVDLGCGTGGQTMVLANHVNCQITGIDRSTVFTDIFNANAVKLNIHNKVRCIKGSMDDIPFPKASLDLIWSEGSVYNIGYKKGLEYWRPFLKSDGYVAITEATWFTNERPKEIEDFWNDAYPEIDTTSNKLEQLEKAGYLPIACFMLPESCWTEHYHLPQIEVQQKFLEKYKGNAFAENFIAFQQHEHDMYNKYKDYYGYTF